MPSEWTGAALAVAAAVIVSGCGTTAATKSVTQTASPTQTASATSSASAASTTSTSSAATTPAAATPTRIPGNAVAIVAGTPITRSVFNGWYFVAAKSQVAPGAKPGTPVIVPTDPPAFRRCIAEARRVPRYAKSSAARLRADCRQLFTTLTLQTMDFLIRARWYLAAAARLGLTPTRAKVDQTLNSDMKGQFRTKRQFQAFLTRSGETTAELHFRVLTSLVYDALLARQTGSPTVRATAVSRQVSAMFRSSTRCARLYVVQDCGNYHAPS